MKGKRSRLALAGTLALALSVTVGMSAGEAAGAKKKKGKKPSNSVTLTKAVNAPVPDRAATPPGVFGQLDTVLTVGKKFKGRKVDTVAVTFQTTGAAPGAAADLSFLLTAPNGRTIFVLGFSGDQSIGPLTLTPNSPVQLCDSPTPPCVNPMATLNRPFAGTAGNPNLALFAGIKMKGNWTFRVQDTGAIAGQTSVLNSVSLQITAAT